MTSHSRLLLRTSFVALVVFIAIVAQAQPNTKEKPTGSIGGRVIVSGKPASDVEVVALGSNSPTRRPTARATTDSEGRYRLIGLAPGAYQVLPIAPTMVAAVNDFDYRIYYGAGKQVLLSEGESVDDIDLSLVRGGVITGRVTDSEGKPVVDQQINLQFETQMGQRTAIESGYANNYLMYRTDDRGIYRLYGLPAGSYKLSVGRDPIRFDTVGSGGSYYVLTYYPDTTDVTKAKIVEVTEGSESTNIDIKLCQRADSFTIKGRVVDAVTGKPVVGVRPTYSIQTGQNGSSSIGGMPTDARGEFRLNGLAPGRYQVFASSRIEGGGYYSDPITIDVVDSDVTGVELKAIQGLTISGVIMPDAQTNQNVISKFANYRIMANVQSEAQPQAYTSGMSAIAADGTFQISGLSPGKVGLYVAPFRPMAGMNALPISRIERNGVDVTRTLEIQSGQSLTDVRVFINYGTGVIRGSVRFINGTMPPDMQMYVGVHREGAQPGEMVNNGSEMDARGNFRITNLPPGTYEVFVNLRVRTPNPQAPFRPRPPLRQTVSVTDETETEVQFVVDSSAEAKP